MEDNDLVLFDDWLWMNGEARETLYQNDVFTTDHLCDKTYNELQDMVGSKDAKSIKQLLNEQDYHLKNADGAAAKKKRFTLEKVRA